MLLLCIAKCLCIMLWTSLSSSQPSLSLCAMSWCWLICLSLWRSVRHSHQVSISWPSSSNHCPSWHPIPHCHAFVVPPRNASHLSFSWLTWIVRERKWHRDLEKSYVPLYSASQWCEENEHLQRALHHYECEMGCVRGRHQLQDSLQSLELNSTLCGEGGITMPHWTFLQPTPDLIISCRKLYGPPSFLHTAE